MSFWSCCQSNARLSHGVIGRSSICWPWSALCAAFGANRWALRQPLVPAHAGTMDVDIVIGLQILADTEAYRTLEDNLKRMGFERAENEALADPYRARRLDGAGAVGRRARHRRR